MPKLAACPIAGARVRTRLADLPETLRQRLSTEVGAMTEAGTAFSAGDALSGPNPPPGRRFLRAYLLRDRAVAWYEHGGVGYHMHAIAFRPGAGPDVYVSIFGQGLCAATQSWFAGKPTGEVSGDR